MADKVIDRAKAHFESFGVQKCSVPEWLDVNGKPTTVYWKPITLAERNSLIPASGNLNDLTLLATIVIQKSLDKEGKKLFAEEDILSLKHKVDSEVLGKLAQLMIATPTPEDQKKK